MMKMKKKKQTTPYTYLIGWSWLDIWYYGRKTAIGCHPDEFWVSYWTSSKEVERYRELHGEPDIIIIKKIFGLDETDKCALWETKVLRRLDAAHHPKMLNKRNGDDKWDTTGKKAAILVATGERLGLVSLLDPRWKTGEIVTASGGKKGQNKGMMSAIIVATGEKVLVRTDDPRRKTGELISDNGSKKGQNKGMFMAIIVATGEKIFVSIDDPRRKTDEIISVNTGNGKGMMTGIIVATGEKVYVSVDDPRRKTGEIIGANKGSIKGMMPAVIVATGEKIFVRTDDPRRKTGELVGMAKGKKWYNNGHKSSQYLPNQQPEGWTLGRLKLKTV